MENEKQNEKNKVRKREKKENGLKIRKKEENEKNKVRKIEGKII